MKYDISSLLSPFSQPDGNVFAELHFMGKIYPIAAFSTSLMQQVDNRGEPQFEVKGAKLNLTLSQLPDELLLQWATSRWMRKSGEVVFKNQTGTAPLRIAFVEAACVYLKQRVNMGKGTYASLLVSAKEISFNGILLESGWIE